MLYLDTHVVVWLYAGLPEYLSERARMALEEGELLVSPMVELELEYLFESERITEHARPILDYLSRKVGLSVSKEDCADVMTTACSLRWTRDPFDRIITAEAMLTDAPLLTKDRSIRENYARALW